MNAVLNGIWAGLLATGPMTLAMFRLQQALPEKEKSPLPPAMITKEIVEPILPNRLDSSSTRQNLTLISHFAYGAACGAAYALMNRSLKSPPIVKGSLFGLAVWGGSYLGWIPAAGLRASAFRMPAKRNGLMILAHLVWGASLGFAEHELRQFGRQVLDGRHRAPLAE